jgi:hypothetical protein
MADATDAVDAIIASEKSDKRDLEFILLFVTLFERDTSGGNSEGDTVLVH